MMPPATGALLHNSSTIAIGLYSMTGLLPKRDIEDDDTEHGTRNVLLKKVK
jgi:hypothetical protein